MSSEIRELSDSELEVVCGGLEGFLEGAPTLKQLYQDWAMLGEQLKLQSQYPRR
jgi:hypothetical protein